jgi:signal transduction histidine kinase
VLRTIRYTIAWLFILPVATMTGLYAYAASGTIGPAIAKQDAATVNSDVGGPAAVLTESLLQEQGETFVWQMGYHKVPSISLPKAYTSTDASITAFEAGLARAQGSLTPASQAAASPLITALSDRSQLRAAGSTQEGSAAALKSYYGYAPILARLTAFSGTLTNPLASPAEELESEANAAAGNGVIDMTSISTLLGGVLTAGGSMTPADYQLFSSLYYDQLAQFTIVANPALWQLSPDPYYQSTLGPGTMNSALLQAQLRIEEKVLQTGSNRATVKLSITTTQLQDTFEKSLAFTGPLQKASAYTRAAISTQDSRQGSAILWRVALVGLGGLLTVIVSTFLLLRFGNRVTRELTGLRNAARALAQERLPSVVRRLRAGDDVDVAAEAPPLDLATRTRELSDTADAFSAVQHAAIEAAVEQATLRQGFNGAFRSLARRNQSLVQRQLKLLDEMERGTQDPDALAQLFRLDHLTTRMRRQAEGLIILSGSAPGRRWRQPVPVAEVLRGAMSEIEDYARVTMITNSSDYLAGTAVADVTHLLAELIENAVIYSPPSTRVQVRGSWAARGYVIEVEDSGMGIAPPDRDLLNERLASPPDFDLTNSDQLGLFVVGRLAIRNNVRVSLRESAFGGTLALVLLPRDLVGSEDEAGRLAQASVHGAIAASGYLADGDAPAGLQNHNGPIAR